jgi:ribonuclease HI
MQSSVDKTSDPVVAFFDGLCEPNPGGWSCGGFIIDPHPGLAGRPLAGHQCFGCNPEMTNNVSEYRAALMALEAIWKAGYRGQVVLRGDSQLVVRQFTGQYGCAAPPLVPLLARLRKAGEAFASLELQWVGREENEAADAESREAYREATGKEPPVRVKARNR